MSAARSRLPLRIPLWALIVVSLSICVFLGSQFVRYEAAIAGNGDTVAYERTAVMINAIRAGKAAPVPDYYPPLANLLFLNAENNILSLPFHRGLLLMIMVTALAAVVFTALCVDPGSLRWAIIAVPGAIALLMPAVFFARFDFFPMLMVLLASLCLQRRKYDLSGVLLMFGCLLKISPVFLVPLYWVTIPRPQRWRFWNGMAAGAIAVIGVSFLTLGMKGTLQSMTSFFTMRTSYPPYALSTASSIDLFGRMLLGGKGTITWMPPDIGHFDTGLPVWISPILLLFAAAGAVWIAWRAAHDPKREQGILLYVSATMMWLLFATPLLTMHYYLWVLPLTFVWFLEQTESTWSIRPWQGLVGLSAVMVALLGHWTYPALYFALVDHQTVLAVTVNFLRNMTVLLLVVALLKAAKEASDSRK